MERATELPALGVGLGYRPALHGGIFRHRPSLDLLEITIDHYLEASPEKRDELELLRAHFPLIPHGLNLSLGSAEGLDGRYLDAVAAVVERLNPPWWSEHVAFTRAGGVEIGHLAPLPRSEEALDALCANIAVARRAIAAPLILENITTTMDLPGAEMSEAEFLKALCERADCGLLLDVTNLWLNATRLGLDPEAALDELLAACGERVVQLHFVGPERRGREWTDTHGGAMTEEVWRLLDRTLAGAPVRAAILERDQAFPPFGELLAEVERARESGRRERLWA
ncbi:MAG: DUF692 family protein [Acidobacteria bacterium]|nr:DUF692 family protein [Acidobacteriota bacterium]